MLMVKENQTLAKLYWGPMPLPGGSQVFGIVFRAPGIAGALIKTKEGIFCQGNNGTLRSIDQLNIERALERVGEPVKEGREG